MSDEIKLAPEEADRVRGIIESATEAMGDVAKGFSGIGATAMMGYTGSGTERAGENYEDLKRTGEALAAALGGLAADLNVTITTGLDTDQQAMSQITQAGPQTAPDLGVLRGF